MISRIIIKFKPDDNIRPNSTLASLFQGVLMENVDGQYADYLHVSSMHPYSQFVTADDNSVIWTVTALSKAAKQQIIDVLASDSFSAAEIKHKNTELHVADKSVTEISYSELLDKYYLRGESHRYLTVNYLTQTAFKSNGKYVIMPTSELILNNLIRKYDSVSEATEIYDDTLIDYVMNHTEIVEYNLRSRKYSMEGISIPSFSGSVRIKLGGNPEFISLCNMLLDFSQYSGTGIKTAMGMGASLITNTGGVI